MYRILIADDEPIALEGLRIFDWARNGCELVCTATNGQQALDMALEHEPHVVFADIRMPRISGIELAEKLRLLLPETVVILFTGYADFRYAQQALQLGVTDYIVKPAGFVEIQRALAGALTLLEGRQARQNRYSRIEQDIQAILPVLRRQTVRELLHGRLDPGSQQVELCGFGQSQYGVLLMDGGRADKPLPSPLLERLWQENKGQAPQAYLYCEEAHLVAVCEFPRGQSAQEALPLVCRWAEQLQQTALNSYGVAVACGISGIGDDIQGLYRRMQEAQYALLQAQWLASGTPLCYHELPEGIPAQASTGPLLADATKAINTQDTALLGKTLDGLQHLLLAENSAQPAVVKLDLIRFLLACVQQVGPKPDLAPFIGRILEGGPGAQAFGAAKQALLQCMDKQYEQSAELQDRIREQVKAYIEQNYQASPSLEELAGLSNYSVSYLSRLVKKSCGKIFIDLLTEHRIEKAKQLLAQDGSLTSIAGAVGYNDSSYFIRVFKKKEGLTPNEYREGLQPSHPGG